MLRLYRHYVSALVIAMVVTDLAIVTFAMGSAKLLGYWHPDGALWPKTAVLAGVILLALYLADLYKVDFRIRRVELVSRLLLAVTAGATLTAAIGFAFPNLRMGRLAFLHIFGVIALGLLGSRLTWTALGPKRRLSHRVLVLGVGRSAGVLPELQFSGARPFTILGFLGVCAASWLARSRARAMRLACTVMTTANTTSSRTSAPATATPERWRRTNLLMRYVALGGLARTGASSR